MISGSTLRRCGLGTPVTSSGIRCGYRMSDPRSSRRQLERHGARDGGVRRCGGGELPPRRVGGNALREVGSELAGGLEPESRGDPRGGNCGHVVGG